MSFQQFFVWLVLLFWAGSLAAQPITKDTIYLPDYPDMIWKIESKRNGKKFGPTFSYTYTLYGNNRKKRRIATYQLYIKDILYGPIIDYNRSEKAYYTLLNYHHNDSIFKQNIINNKVYDELSLYPHPYKIQYFQYIDGIKKISYPLSKEVVELHPNQRVKSLQILNNTVPANRSYYEFSPEGTLLVEGTFADSFVTVVDEIIRYGELLSDGYTILKHEEPLKHGEWFYYSNKGVLQEKKVYTYFTEKTIYTED